MALMALVAKDGLFSADEVACARELIDSALSDPSRGGDYRVLVAVLGERLLGYICYGPTPMTEGTFDLYWIAADPEHRSRGVGSALCQAMEREIGQLRGRLIRVETSTTAGYGAAQRLYARNGYQEACRIRDFYRPGDDLITLTKRVQNPDRDVTDSPPPGRGSRGGRAPG